MTRVGDSIKKRYAVTLLANGVRFLGNGVSSILVPRALSPGAFGNYQFILRFVTALRGFLDMNAFTAFFTRSAEGGGSSTLLLYSIWQVLQLLVLVATFLLFAVFGHLDALLPGQAAGLVLLVSVMDWISNLSVVSTALGESKAHSVHVQKVSAVAIFVRILFIAALYVSRRLTVHSFIAVNVAIALLQLGFNFRFFLRQENRGIYFQRVTRGEIKVTTRYFASFCSPLVVYEILALLFNCFDPWFLQVVSGAEQQGFFSLGTQWTMVITFFSSSVVNIFWREVSYSKSAEDWGRIQRLYSRSSAGLFYLAAALAFFLFFQSWNLIHLFMTPSYYAGVAALRWLALASLYTTSSQVNATIMYATSQTRSYRNTSIVNMLVSMLLTYFLLAPGSFAVPGLNLQSSGLALKQFLSVVMLTMLQSYVISCHLQVSYRSSLLHQVKTFIGFLALGGLLAKLIELLLPDGAFGPLLRLLAYSAVFFPGVVAMALRWPAVFGGSKEDTAALMNAVSSRLTWFRRER